MKRNKYCPHKAKCKDSCYEGTHCEYAKAFDRLGARIERLELEKHNLKIVNEKLHQQNSQLKSEKQALTIHLDEEYARIKAALAQVSKEDSL